MNLFLPSKSYVSVFIEHIYSRLMTREFVSYLDVFTEVFERDHKRSISSDRHYKDLQKAFPMVIKELEARVPGCIIDNGKRKGRAYKYIGKDDDPLAEDRLYSRRQTIDDYVRFCKSSTGFLPVGWFDSFFRYTYLLHDTKRNSSDSVIISSTQEQVLNNIDLLPALFQHITEKNVISFKYEPFGKNKYPIVIHPQFLKEYNGRWFLFGVYDNSKDTVSVIPLDRIASEITTRTDLQYFQQEKGFYQKYFKDIVGVSHIQGNNKEHIIIRTHSVYLHGLIRTKKMHDSQQEVISFGCHSGELYGEFSLDVEPNNELIGKILTYGQFLEVVSPTVLRDKVKNIINETLRLYQ